MAVILYDSIELCTCCTMKLANDDTSGCFCEPHHNVGGEPLSKIEREFDGLDWSRASLVIDKSGEELGYRENVCLGCGIRSQIDSECVILV